nr:MAG TPA: hypothetical protein [Caudoviricetes sp.]
MTIKFRRQQPNEEPNILIDHENDRVVIASTFYLKAIVYIMIALFSLIAYLIISLIIHI